MEDQIYEKLNWQPPEITMFKMNGKLAEECLDIQIRYRNRHPKVF